MNETMVTLVGHVATEPTLRITTGGARVTSFRLASTERRFDKGINDWRDAYTTFFTVTTWRTMAENVCTSGTVPEPSFFSSAKVYAAGVVATAQLCS